MKKYLATLSILAIGGAILMTSRPADAFWPFQSQTAPTNQTQTSNSLIEQISQKFHLDKTEVNKVVDQYRQERFQQRWQERQTEVSQGLDKAVKDGILSPDQKKAFMDIFNKNQNQRLEHHQEMIDWLEKNNLNPSQLREYIGAFGRHHGQHQGQGRNHPSFINR